MEAPQLKQLYYSLVHPYISYAILAWGSGAKTQIKKVQTKQNTVIRTIFFATTRGKNTENAFPLMNLIDILTVTSIFKLQALKFAHRWLSKALPNIFENYFQYANDIHSRNTRYASKKIFISRAQEPRSSNQDLLTSLKNLNTFTFPGKVKKFENDVLFSNDAGILGKRNSEFSQLNPVSKIMPTTAFICAYFLS